MLHELITYATTRCPPFARRMGYLYEAVALRARYGRHRDSWQHHLEKTRRFVIAEAMKCPGRDKAIILGSGLLLDVPLEELCDVFREVVLVDVVFLAPTRKAIQAHGNAHAIELDVTGVAVKLHHEFRKGLPSLPELRPAIYDLASESSLMVSLNILSQLSVIPERYIKRKLPQIGDSLREAWCAELISSHYQDLNRMPCSVCLVSDYQYVKRDPRGAMLEKGDTLRGITLPSPDEAWTWDIAPLGEYSRHFSKQLTVGAWHMR